MNQGDQSAAAAFGSRLARLRDPVEDSFGRFGHWVYRHAWPTIVVVLLGVIGLCTQLLYVQLDTSTERMFPADDPVRVAYDRFREQYGRDQVILIAVETENLFNSVVLEKLRDLHEELERELPHLDEVRSLLNARHTRGEGDELVVGDLFEDWPETAAEIEVIRDRVRGNPLYVDQLISRDEKTATLIVRPNAYSSLGDEVDALEVLEFDTSAGEHDADAVTATPTYLTGEENTELVIATDEIVRRHDGEGFRIYMAGMPVMVDRLMRAMLADMGRFTGLALVTIAFLLAIVFRRVAAVVLPLTVSSLAMLCTLSVMAMLEIPLSTTTQITPSFLLAVGVGGAVHILSIFYQGISAGESKEDAIAHALRHSGLAVVMTSLTTAGGMVSFMSADILPLIEMGIVTPIGILLALFFSIVLLPALIAVIPIRTAAHGELAPQSISPTRRILMRCGDFATENAWLVVGCWAIVLGLSVLGAQKLELSHDPIGWFAEDDPFRQGMEKLNDDLNGTMFVEIIIDTGVENGIQDPAILNRMDELREYVTQVRDHGLFVGKTASITDIVKETHRGLNENRAEYYSIPQDPKLVAQELLLFENSGSNDIEEWVDSQFREARFTMKMPLDDAIHYSPFLDRIEEHCQRIFGESVSITLTGESRIMTEVVNVMTYNLLKTYSIAIMIITPLMIFLLGSLRLGLVSMIPNLAPILITLGIMGWFGIPLEIFTLLIGSIALGLAVDDTVHFMHNFRRTYELDGDVVLAVRETLGTTGEALLFTSLALSSGFFIYMFATMSNLFFFGLLTGITIILAFLADIILAPALMAILASRLLRLDSKVGEAETA